MASPSHLHLHLLACPQTLALSPPSSRAPTPTPSAAPRLGLGLRSRRLRLRLRPVAALGPADAGDLLGRVEAFLYTVADAAVSAAPEAAAEAKEAAAASGDWLSGITNSMETVLKVRLRVGGGSVLALSRFNWVTRGFMPWLLREGRNVS
jgi:YidC/Oxa1 family membrane protein insertase